MYNSGLVVSTVSLWIHMHLWGKKLYQTLIEIWLEYFPRLKQLIIDLSQKPKLQPLLNRETEGIYHLWLGLKLHHCNSWSTHVSLKRHLNNIGSNITFRQPQRWLVIALVIHMHCLYVAVWSTLHQTESSDSSPVVMDAQNCFRTHKDYHSCSLLCVQVTFDLQATEETMHQDAKLVSNLRQRLPW